MFKHVTNENDAIELKFINSIAGCQYVSADAFN